jgi:hypothetical protein
MKSSHTSRSSFNSEPCKSRDRSTCCFCGYSEPEDNGGLEAAHLAELGKIRSLKLPSEKQEFLDSLELLTINDIVNLITLCEGCHKYFDKKGGYKIGIEPKSLKLIIANSIRDKTNHFCKKKFVELHGKQIVFLGASHQKPTAKLLEHRFQIFTENNQQKPTKSNQLKDPCPILYCVNCKYFTFVEKDFTDHVLSCSLRNLTIASADI